MHPPTHTTRARTHAPTMCAHNTPTPALPTHPPTMHLLASSHVDVTHGIRHRVRGRCARHTRTFHTSHTDSENGPRADAATPPGRMDTSSSMTAHKAWSPFVDAAMMRWFSSRAPPKIDRGSHDVLCVREAWHGGRIHCHRPRRCETVGGSMYEVFFALRGGKESVTTQTSVHTVRCRV